MNVYACQNLSNFIKMCSILYFKKAGKKKLYVKKKQESESLVIMH